MDRFLILNILYVINNNCQNSKYFQNHLNVHQLYSKDYFVNLYRCIKQGKVQRNNDSFPKKKKKKKISIFSTRNGSTLTRAGSRWKKFAPSNRLPPKRQRKRRNERISGEDRERGQSAQNAFARLKRHWSASRRL